MSFWDVLIGNAKGVRETMQRSYERHLRRAQSGAFRAPDYTPHQMALYDTLATRYQAAGQSPSPPTLCAELAPFFGLPNAEGCEALAEYVVYCEQPGEANVTALRRQINSGIRKLGHVHRKMACVGAQMGVPWASMLLTDVRRSLDEMLDE